MVDLILNDEQLEYRKLAREFAQKQLAPQAHQHDVSAEVALDLLRGAWETGLVNVRIPSDLGGLGLTMWDEVVIAEELASGCSGITAPLEANSMAVATALQSRNKTLIEKLLKPATEEFVLGGVALGLFCETPSQSLVAEKQGEGFLLRGEITIANATTANWFMVPARLDGALTLFVVSSKANGVLVRDNSYLLGRRASDLRVVQFQSTKLTDEDLIGTIGGALEILDGVRPAAYALLAAGTVGLARSAMEHAIRYAKERRTFGKPIAEHQAVAFMLADMAKEIEAGRLLTWQTAAMIDGDESAAMAASTARSFCQTMAVVVATDAVQVFGGYGYSKEYPVEKLMRDAQMYQLLDGAASELNVQAGRALLFEGSPGAPHACRA